MPVEVIRLEVEQHCDPRAELVDPLELETRELADDPGLRGELAVELAERPADVARDRDLLAGGLEDRTEELGCRRLPVRAGHAQDGVRQQARAELDLAPDGHIALAGGLDELRVLRHSRALDDELNLVQDSKVVLAASHLDARVRESLGVHLGAIDADHLDRPPSQCERSRPPGAGEPQHEHAIGQVGQVNPGK